MKNLYANLYPAVDGVHLLSVSFTCSKCGELHFFQLKFPSAMGVVKSE